jgi:phosphoenolpyruvate-protein phosphotransferase
MLKLIGIPAAPGLAIGPTFRFQEVNLVFPRSRIEDVHAEWQRLEPALQAARKQLKDIQSKAERETGAEEASIFEAHLMFLDDPTLLNAVRQSITDDGINLEAAWMDAIEQNASLMEAMDDEYFRARSADIRDVGTRVLRNLMGIEEADLSSLRNPSIVIARDLTPSDTVRLERDLLLGFCTAEGGPTSHTAILAKALGIPAIVGCGKDLLKIENETILAIDGASGDVLADPDKGTQSEFRDRLHDAEIQAQADLSRAHEPAITPDGVQVEVVANVGNVDDAVLALQHGAEGIGLLRTEFLYLDRTSAPDEDEQLAAFTDIFSLMGDRPLVVRTLDVGGDKELPYLDLGKEANPFLGWRAIRMCLDEPDFFKVQLRALLRASPGHDLRIMFPMIATIDEVRRAKALLDEARSELNREGQPVAEEIQIGIMVEIPSVAVLADQFSKEVDFFSIGTNDLTQYTFAAERTNEKVASLTDPCHPAILRQIHSVIQAAHDQGIWVGLCGEMAGDPKAIPLLLGLGLDEFSMAPSLIPRAKSTIRAWPVEKARKISQQAMELENARDVRALT